MDSDEVRVKAVRIFEGRLLVMARWEGSRYVPVRYANRASAERRVEALRDEGIYAEMHYRRPFYVLIPRKHAEVMCDHERTLAGCAICDGA